MNRLCGHMIRFLESCGPIPEGTIASCIGYCDKKGIIRIWLNKPVLGIFEFGISKHHMSKIKII